MKIKNFWDKVNKNAPNGCWEWTGAVRRSGYGAWKGPNGLVVDAHRFIFNIINKIPVPDDMLVLHSCDNRICCNPAHLRLGTYEENIEDMQSRGRDNYAQGENTNRNKLTAKEVEDIRMFYSTGTYSYKKLGDKYGVDKSTIRAIIIGKTWRIRSTVEQLS